MLYLIINMKKKKVEHFNGTLRIHFYIIIIHNSTFEGLLFHYESYLVFNYYKCGRSDYRQLDTRK